VAALSLGIINQFTSGVIKTRIENDKKAVIKTLVTEGSIGSMVDVREQVVQAYYPVEKYGQIIAYILELHGTGYGGDIKILAAYSPNGKILAAQLTEHNETPGLGDKAKEPVYMHKFVGTGAGEPVPVSKEMLAKRAKASASAASAASAARPSFGRPQYNSLTEWLFGKVAATEAQTDSVSGATITFLGVSRALEAGAYYVKTVRGGK
jgi:electron transport complex protein RnfG